MPKPTVSALCRHCGARIELDRRKLWRHTESWRLGCRADTVAEPVLNGGSTPNPPEPTGSNAPQVTP